MSKIKKVYIWTITPEAWEPWSNTMSYFPFNSQYQFSDTTWNFTPSATSNISITTLNWIECAYNSNINGYATFSKNFSTWGNAHTWSCWVYRTSNSPERQVIASTWQWSWTNAKVMWFHYQNLFFWGWSNDTYDTVEWPLNQRFNFIWTYDWTTSKCYYNGTLVKTKTQTYTASSNNYASLFDQRIQGTGWGQWFLWYIKDLVMENVAWSDNDVTDYYNRSRYNYEDMPKYIEIWPWEEKDNWILFDESDFATSTPSKNSQFHYSWWNGTTYWTNTSYDTTNKRIYANNSHCLAWFILNDSTALVGAKKIKIIWDYAYCYNSNTYSSGVHLMPFNLSMTYSLSVNWETWTTYSPALNTFLTHSTPYSSEFIYDFDTDSWTLKVTNLSNQTETQCTVTWFKQYWDSKVNSWSLELFSMYKDQWSSSYLWDYHIYYVPGWEPAPQGWSVDFTTTSRAALSADWWTYTNEAPWIDSWGFYCSNTSHDKYSSLWYPIDLTGANKIYIKAIINWSSGSWTGWPSFWIFKDTSSSYPYVSWSLSFTNYNGYNGQWMDINSSWTNNTYKTYSTISWLYTLEVTVDFTTSKASYNLGGVYSTEVNIYPSDTFRQCAYIRCEAWHWIYNWVRVRSIEWDIT